MTDVRTNYSGTGGGAFDDNHDLKEQLRDLSQETITLIRQEFELVKAELGEKTDFLKDQLQLTSTQARHEIEHAKTELAGIGKKAGVGAGLFGAATLLALGAFGVFTAAMVAGLGVVMPVWAAALIVAALYGIAGGGLAMAGRAKVKEVGAPVPETIGRFKSLFNFRKDAITSELSSIPQETLGSLNSVRDDLQDAWRRGSQHRHGSG